MRVLRRLVFQRVFQSSHLDLKGVRQQTQHLPKRWLKKIGDVNYGPGNYVSFGYLGWWLIILNLTMRVLRRLVFQRVFLSSHLDLKGVRQQTQHLPKRWLKKITMSTNIYILSNLSLIMNTIVINIKTDKERNRYDDLVYTSKWIFIWIIPQINIRTTDLPINSRLIS